MDFGGRLRSITGLLLTGQWKLQLLWQAAAASSGKVCCATQQLLSLAHACI
jgi:hypothetical protein